MMETVLSANPRPKSLKLTVKITQGIHLGSDVSLLSIDALESNLKIQSLLLSFF